MSALSQHASRAVWLWCVAYTALAPPDPRDRRRDEIRSHLWESERALLAPKAVAAAALRGALNDLLWAASRGLPRLARSFATPTPYVALAPVFPIQAWIVSALSVGAVAHLSEGLGAIGGGVMLMLAALAWVVQRLRD